MLPYLTAFLFYFDRVSSVGGLCFWRRRLKKVANFLWGKKCSRWPGLRIFLTSKWPGSFLYFTALAFAPDDLPHDLSDLEKTCLPLRLDAVHCELVNPRTTGATSGGLQVAMHRNCRERSLVCIELHVHVFFILFYCNTAETLWSRYDA